jgi:serine/threonine protein kinase
LLELKAQPADAADGDYYRPRCQKATVIWYRYDIIRNTWMWCPDTNVKKIWMDVTETVVREGFYAGCTPVQANVKIIKALRRLNPRPRLLKKNTKRLIGSGGFGRVYCYETNRTGNSFLRAQGFTNPYSCAVKYIPYSHDEDISKISEEVAILQSIARSPIDSIVKCWDAVIDKRQKCVQVYMEYCDGHIRSLFPLDNDASLRLLIALIDALKFIHGCNIYHRDIKPENILYVTLPDGQRQYKVADFGLARYAETVGPTRLHPGYVAGSFGYVAPEAILHCNYEKTDIWATGVVLYEGLTNTMPFQDVADLLDPSSSFTPTLASDVFPVLREVIKACLIVSVARRPDIRQLHLIQDRYTNRQKRRRQRKRKKRRKNIDGITPKPWTNVK